MRPAGIPKTSGILLRRIFVFLWFFHKLLITPYKFWKWYLPYVPPSCASSDCRENRSQGCQIHEKYPPFRHVLYITKQAEQEKCLIAPPRRSVLFFTNSNLVTLHYACFTYIMPTIVQLSRSATMNNNDSQHQANTSITPEVVYCLSHV